MFDFLKTVATPPVPIWNELARVVGALVLGWLVGLVYRRTRPTTKDSSSMHATLVLLSVLIAIVVQVVGESPARAFSLVGALSIIRFRTVVQDTQDTAFVIFAVVMGMAAGAEAPWIATIGFCAVTLAAYLLRSKGGSSGATFSGFILKMRAAVGTDVEALVSGPFATHLSTSRLVSMETAKQGTAVEALYQVAFLPAGSSEGLVKALNRLEGVQHVQLLDSEFEDD